MVYKLSNLCENYIFFVNFKRNLGARFISCKMITATMHIQILDTVTFYLNLLIYLYLKKSIVTLENIYMKLRNNKKIYLLITLKNVSF